jgi:endoglucanase
MQLWRLRSSCRPARGASCRSARQVASREFFLKTLPLFDSGDDIAMVLSPQCFHNLNLHSDIFNHSNVHFWEYMQPGYDALGFISCTGTNFLVPAGPPPGLLAGPQPGVLG